MLSLCNQANINLSEVLPMRLMNIGRCCANVVARLVAGLVVSGLVANYALAVSEYFDVNGATPGSGVTAITTLKWENNWSTDPNGAIATTDWPDGNNFPIFAAAADAAALNYTVTANVNHTFAGMKVQANGGGTVTVATAAGIALTMDSNPTGQGFFVGTGQNLTITGAIAGDATTPLFWSGGGGSLFLYGNNTYAGGTILNASQGLNFNNANSFGTGPITYNTTLTTAVFANPIAGNFTIANPVTMRDNPTGNITMIYAGIAPPTFTDWTLGTQGTNSNIITLGNSTFPNSKLIINNLKGSTTSNLTVNSGANISGTLVLTGTSNYGGETTIGTGATGGTPTLQADEGSGLLASNDLVLNGGVFQTSTMNFTRTLATMGGISTFAWNVGGGGFSAITNPLTVNINGNNGELAWGDTVADEGSKILGPLKLGSVTSNAKTLFVNPIDLNNTGTAGLTRTISVAAGAGGDLSEVSGVIRNSAVATGLTKAGTGTLLLSAANTYTGTTSITGGALQATQGVGLPNNFLDLNGGVYQGNGVATSFTRTLGASGSANFQFNTGGGGFSANGGQMTVNVGGSGGQLVWGTTVGSQIVGPMIFGSNTANAETLFVNPIDLGAAARTVTVNSGAGGDSAELSGVLSSSGAGGLTKNGTGTLLLSNANSYTGGTSVITGTLAIGNNGALGSGVLTLGGTGAINPTVISSGSPRTIANGVILSTIATGGGAAQIGGSNDLTINGALTNSGAGRTLTVSNTGMTTFANVDLSEVTGTGRTLTITGAGNITFGGVIENFAGGGGTAGGLTFNGSYSGTATITQANTYTGTTTLTAGTGKFVLGNKAAFGTGTIAANGVTISASTDLSGANAIANATVNLGGNNTFSGSNNIQFSGTVSPTASRTVTNNMAGASLTFSGPVNLGSTTANRTLTIAGTGNTSITGAIANGAGPSLGGLTKTGNGTLTLSGVNTYNGPTAVNGGLLLANTVGGSSSTGTGAVTVGSSGTLGGTGTVSGAVTNNGIIAPGVGGVGILSVGGGVTDGANSSWSIVLNGASSNKLAVTGILDLSAVDSLNVTGAGTGTSWLIGTYTGTASGAFDTVTSGYSVIIAGGNIMLNAAAVGSLPGDYNQNGVVDAADYVLWRANVGQPAGTLPNDTAGGTIGDGQYALWRSSFGNHSGAGSGLSDGSAVPEPGSLGLLLLGLIGMAARGKR
jgi:fibronectin-binding autotransporter adhesin